MTAMVLEQRLLVISQLVGAIWYEQLKNKQQNNYGVQERYTNYIENIHAPIAVHTVKIYIGPC